MSDNHQNEKALWSQFRSGDRYAFAAIYEIHIDALVAYGCKMTGDRELLKDNIQDLFIELWNARTGLVEIQHPRYYLIKSLRYKLLRAERGRHHTLGGSPSLEYTENSVETDWIEKETSASRSEILRAAIRTLSKRQQEVIQLRFYQGFTNEQIAQLLQVNYQSVSNLLHASLCRIKKNLQSSPVLSSALLAVLHFLF